MMGKFTIPDLSPVFSPVFVSLMNSFCYDVELSALTEDMTMERMIETVSMQHRPALPWLVAIPAITNVILYSDYLTRMYISALCREKNTGEADELMNFYVSKGSIISGEGGWRKLFPLTEEAAINFDRICNDNVVRIEDLQGDLMQRFYATFHTGLIHEKAGNGIRITPPMLSEVVHYFNDKLRNEDTVVRTDGMEEFLIGYAARTLMNNVKKFEKAAAANFRFL